MKILMVNDMGYKHGGAEVYMFTLKRHLELKGHKVEIFSSNDISLSLIHI